LVLNFQKKSKKTKTLSNARITLYDPSYDHFDQGSQMNTMAKAHKGWNDFFRTKQLQQKVSINETLTNERKDEKDV
jgi:hypothetical protein